MESPTQHPTLAVNGTTNGVTKPVKIESVASPNSDTEPHSLHVVDSRTGKYYNIAIAHNAIKASDFKKIKTPENSSYYADQNEQGLRIYDPGFSNTAVSESSVTYIDGSKGVIQYRGYSISDILQKKKQFLDTAYLLIWGEWPSTKEKAQFHLKLNAVPLPAECVFNTIRSFPSNGSPLGMTIAGLSALQSTQMPLVPAHAAKNLYLGNPELVDQEIIKFLSNFSIITAAAYCHQTGRPFTNPRPELSYIENFFLMIGHVEEATQLPNPKYVSCFERLWVLVADHEMTCSTAALLQTASSLPDLYSCVISAISALYGPLHGGAIEVAYKDFEAIGTVDNIDSKLNRVKSGKERLFGYGHRIYRVLDPRYVFIKDIMEELKEEVARDPLLEVASEIDRIAQTDEYFTSRNLKPNADLFAAFAYKAMGFPPEIILPISLLSRAQGFMAHWKEAMSGSPRIWRPGQLYVGKLDRKIVD